MLGLRPVIRLLALAYLRWALREMGPMHEDTPHVVRRIAYWEAS